MSDQAEPKQSKSKKQSVKAVSETEIVKEVETPISKSKLSLYGDIIPGIFNGYGETGTDVLKADCKKQISEYLRQIAEQNPIIDKYNVLILYDNNSLIKGDADNIYNAVTAFNNKKPLLLVLYSPGGIAASAYLIGKLCREYSNGKFFVSVPRHAKSAATLMCCAADEIHMGSLSELGPIDPQIDGLPALGLKNSIEHIAQLVKENPEATEMFAKYLNSSLTLINLGYYERVAESAMQYAEKLLLTHEKTLPKPAKNIAEELVYRYKDHGFVIDKSEAEQIFGTEIIKNNTKEYELGNSLYTALNSINSWFGYFKKNFYFIGSLDNEPTIINKN